MSDSLESRIRTKAEAMGFTLFGIAPATDADGFDRFTAWLDAGYAGEMTYLHDYREHRRHPRSVRPWVRSVVMLGMEYTASEQLPDESARIAKYAMGPDYHRFIWDRVNELSAWLMAEVPGCRAHGVADTAPLLERDFARRAGLGWFGKNTMLINKHRGSYFFLSAFLTDIELTPSQPHDATHCGTCTACLDACPTKAFPAPGVLDARKCISYLTIELRGPMPEELRPLVDNWLFGCDICQDVCPWNSRPHRQALPTFPPNTEVLSLDAVELLTLSPTEFKARFAGTSLLRARRTGLLRNAAIALGNTGGASALPALERAATDADPVIAEAAVWAIQRLRERASEAALPPATTAAPTPSPR